MRVLSTWHGPVKKYVLVYVSWSNTQLHAYVARASWICAYLLSTCYGSLLVTQRMLKWGSMIVQLWWWKTTPTMVTPSIAYQSPVSTDQQLIPEYILQGISFLLLGWTDFLERSIAPSASRRSHIPLCCGIWFMSSAWLFALATQTVLAVRFCTRSSCDFVS